ncbi:MAG: right-handed parallel beta-helix repeat-containing protein [Armatimonadota bacterium]
MDSHSHRRGADGIGSFVALMIAAALLAGAAAPGVAQPVTRVSIATGGGQSDGPSLQASFSAGGRHVAFSSYAGNLVPGDTNDQQDVFVHDSQTGQTTRVSIASDATQSDNRSFTPSISADGRYVAFASQATNLTALQPAAQQVYVHDRATGETTCVSVDGQGEPGDAASGVPSISADGRYVAFSSYADNFIPGDAVPGKADIYVRDRLTGSTVCASLAQDGTNSDGDSHRPSISANGRYVAFYSEATDLVPGDTNGSQDVFVHDLTTGQTSRVSVATGGAQADGDSLTVSISADGSCVAFESDATNLVAADTNGVRDVFAHDRTTGVTTRVSVSTHGAEGDRLSATPSISDDGRFVAFASPNNTTLVPGITKGGIYAHDRTTGHTSHVSTDDFGNQGVGASIYPSISGEGRLIAFESDATNLVTGDTNGVRDIFVRDWWPAQIVETGERYPSIETAIDAAVSGQTIEVAPGTCHEDVNFSGNNITLRSRDPNDPAVVAATVINGSGAGPVVTFANGETADAVLAGLTITGGGGAAGAGVHCTGSSPTISRNVIEGNEALGQDSAYGGGVYVSGGRPSIVNNTINSNRTRADVRNPSHGAGIFASASDVTITGNTITANNCWQGYKRGGGVYCVGGSPVITDNTIGENISWYGGGVYCIDSTITLTGNTIENNEVSVQGGGIYWRNSTGTIADNTVASNRNGTRTSTDLGGGIFASQGSVSIRGNTIVGNVSTGGAGGLFCGADAEIIGNIISGNTGESQNTDRAGGGVYCSGARDITIRGNTMAANSGGAIELYASSPAIVNNTLHGNEATGGAGVNCLNGSSPTINSTIIASSRSGSGVAADGTSTPVIRYSNVFGNAGGNYAGMDDQTGLYRCSPYASL